MGHRVWGMGHRAWGTRGNFELFISLSNYPLLPIHSLLQPMMYHTRDSQLADFLAGKLYDIWDTVSHKPLAVMAVDSADVLVV